LCVTGDHTRNISLTSVPGGLRMPRVRLSHSATGTATSPGELLVERSPDAEVVPGAATSLSGHRAWGAPPPSIRRSRPSISLSCFVAGKQRDRGGIGEAAEGCGSRPRSSRRGGRDRRRELFGRGGGIPTGPHGMEDSTLNEERPPRKPRGDPRAASSWYTIPRGTRHVGGGPPSRAAHSRGDRGACRRPARAATSTRAWGEESAVGPSGSSTRPGRPSESTCRTRPRGLMWVKDGEWAPGSEQGVVAAKPYSGVRASPRAPIRTK